MIIIIKITNLQDNCKIMAKGNKTGKGGFRDNPQNINKKGRPIAGESYKDIIKRLEEEDYIDKNGKNLGNSKELMLKAWQLHAINGSIGHLREWLDRCEGKVPIPYKELTDEIIDLNDLRKTLIDAQNE